MSATLPEQFAELEGYAADWCLATEAGRYAKRMASSMDEMQTFYDAITPKAEAAIVYCDGFALDAMPDEAVNLLRMLYSMIMVSFPVEVWSQARVPDTGAATLACVVEPTP